MKQMVLVGLALLLVGSIAGAQSVGGGVSLWIPESTYLADEGSLGVETALGTSIGFTDIVSVPIGLVFNQVYGLMAESDGELDDSPWFYSDTALAFAMLKGRIPLGSLYVDAFGGLAGVWNMSLRPLTKNIESDRSSTGQLLTFEEISLSDGRLGWGWQAGGGIGVRIGQISVDINATYRIVRTEVTVTGETSTIAVGGGTVSEDQPFSETIKARLAGFSVGIDGSFAF